MEKSSMFFFTTIGDAIQAISLDSVLYACLATVLVLIVATPPLRKSLYVLFRMLFFWFIIYVEDKVYKDSLFETFWRDYLFRNSLTMPRDLNETLKDKKQYLFQKLKQNKHVPASAKLESITRSVLIESEPEKNRTAGSLIVNYYENESLDSDFKTLHVFIKSQSGRGMPKWLQALRQAAEPGVAREVDFYAKLKPFPPFASFPTPTPLFLDKAPMFNYVFICIEYIDLAPHKHDNNNSKSRGNSNSNSSSSSSSKPSGGGDKKSMSSSSAAQPQAHVVNDADGATVEEVTLMLETIAKLHSHFVTNDISQFPLLKWIPARRGLEFAQFIDNFMDKTDKAFSVSTWMALKRYFESRPVSFVHGDCRPGNMIFYGTRRNPTKVLFCDFEAVNVAPPFWDFTYCTTLGWNAKTKRANQKKMFYDVYLKNCQCDLLVKEKADEYFAQVSLLTIVLAYLSRTIKHGGYWDRQGNTANDKTAWWIRVGLGVYDLTPDLFGLNEMLGVEKGTIEKMQYAYMRELHTFSSGREEKPMEDW